MVGLVCLGDGYYGQSSPADVMQEENDRIADSLRDKVKSLKLVCHLFMFMFIHLYSTKFMRDILRC